MILAILLIVSAVVFFIFLVRYFDDKRMLLDAFKRGNVIVFGKKGKGKDLLFQYIINCRKANYLSNISYGGKYESVSLNEVSCPGNSYENLINEDYVVSLAKDWEKKDIYISDCGVYLPSQYDTKLYKQFPSLPIYYALSRHLYYNNVHCNTQNLTRVWKALREQADSYVKCRGVIKLPFFLCIKWCYYDKYESASNNILPIGNLRGLIFRKRDDSVILQFKATNGLIVNGFSLIRKSKIKYNTRIFRDYLLTDNVDYVNIKEVRLSDHD